MVELCILNNRMFLVARISSDCFESFSKMNWWIHCGQGLIGSFDLPWSKWSRITDPDPDHIKGTHPKTVLDSESHSMDSGFLVLDSSFFHWNLNSRFHSLMGFRIPWAVFWIPKPRISDSTRKKFHGLQNSDSLTRSDTPICSNLCESLPCQTESKGVLKLTKQSCIFSRWPWTHLSIRVRKVRTWSDVRFFGKKLNRFEIYEVR